MDVIEGESSAIRVLYVDDDEGLLALTKRFLESSDDGIEVETTDSPRRALRLLESESFDAVVSDYQMPEMSGLELLSELRDGRDSGIPFVIFTGRSREEVAIEALNLGADSYLQKGGDPTAQYGVLRQTLVRITEHRRAERRLREREAYLRVTLDSIAEGVVATDADGTVVQLNRTAEEITGYDAEAAVGEQLSDVLHLVDGATGERIDPVRRVADADGPVELAAGTKLVTSDGDERYIEDSMSPIRTDDGSVEGVVAVFRDVTEAYRERERRERQQRALIDLATDETVIAGSFEDALPRITETMATVLDVERASVWLFDDAETLRCVDQYDRSSGEHNAGTTLTASNYPAYFAALETNRSLGVDDVRTDPATAELRDGYLEQKGITSLLDATVRSGGEVVGVVCHEHVGEPRRWRSDERRFAAEVADNVVIALMRATDVDALPTSADEDGTDETRPGRDEG
ncbi:MULTISPECIES: response regulator [unclassified Haloferax]|uniref:response regulator n=1 Tax=Haloferax TaxID=2251 RepID=UPI0002B1B8D2|nr:MULTISPECIES: response regulator [unclassified Haloferax]ELZ59638.1 HTR-like protein [Haloferax sp. ATCC BAA-646]ELZ60527.1 HTR-like protein [Haloferax sp. ATCC BAA-645]ELZ72162.1 HTR-like protein [Haloferax sp. ATCC BAA-644]